MPSRTALTVATLFALALALSSSASAQTTSPAAPTMTPAPTCEKPGDVPGVNTSELGKAGNETKRNNWIRGMKAYLECLKKFIEEHQAEAAPHVRAANAAVEEYNKSIKVLNEQIEAAKPQ